MEKPFFGGLPCLVSLAMTSGIDPEPITSLTNLQVAAFAESIKDPKVTVLDVRTAVEFAEGHIAGAINVDVTQPNFSITIAKLDPKKTYAVYCRSGVRSSTAAKQMTDQGFEHIQHLKGGIISWQKSGLEVVK